MRSTEVDNGAYTLQVRTDIFGMGMNTLHRLDGLLDDTVIGWPRFKQGGVQEGHQVSL